jgi:hypothetical protein
MSVLFTVTMSQLGVDCRTGQEPSPLHPQENLEKTSPPHQRYTASFQHSSNPLHPHLSIHSLPGNLQLENRCPRCPGYWGDLTFLQHTSCDVSKPQVFWNRWTSSALMCCF